MNGFSIEALTIHIQGHGHRNLSELREVLDPLRANLEAEDHAAQAEYERVERLEEWARSIKPAVSGADLEYLGSTAEKTGFIDHVLCPACGEPVGMYSAEDSKIVCSGPACGVITEVEGWLRRTAAAFSKQEEVF